MIIGYLDSWGTYPPIAPTPQRQPSERRTLKLKPCQTAILEAADPVDL